MSDNNSNDKRCFSCGRTEKEAGKLTHMPNGFYVCSDCLKSVNDLITSKYGDFNLGNIFGGRQQESKKTEEVPHLFHSPVHPYPDYSFCCLYQHPGYRN